MSDPELKRLREENAALQASLQGTRAEQIQHLVEANEELQKHLSAAPTEQTHIARRHYTRQGERLAAQSEQIRELNATIDALRKEVERLRGIVGSVHEHIRGHLEMVGTGPE